MKLIFADEAWDDYLYWQNKRMVARINKLIRETQREPFAGVGKPEALKHALAGFWSRRSTDEHRMVYRIEGDALLIAFALLRHEQRIWRVHHPRHRRHACGIIRFTRG